MRQETRDRDRGAFRALEEGPFEYRVSADCVGPVIVPIELKPPREDDYVVELRGQGLYIPLAKPYGLGE